MTTPTPATEALRPDWLTTLVWPQSVHHVRVDGTDIAYTDVGAGPTLLFVHVGMWSILWRDIIDQLQGRYRCVTLDAPGCGLSERPSGTLTLENAAAVSAVVAELDLTDITLVVHDLGAPAALHAASAWADRIAGLCVISGFGWRPSGPMFRGKLAMMGNPIVRELDAATGWLPRASATRFGVGRRWNRATRQAFRRGLRRPQRRSLHHYMSAARYHDYTTIDNTLRTLATRPAPTIFGQRNDPLRFQRKWKTRFPQALQITIAKGYHFPMCDTPTLVATTIDNWHRHEIARGR